MRVGVCFPKSPLACGEGPDERGEGPRQPASGFGKWLCADSVLNALYWQNNFSAGKGRRSPNNANESESGLTWKE